MSQSKQDSTIISRLPSSNVAEKIEILDPDGYKADQTMLTIVLHEEDHTIGNALKHIICQMPGVEFCGYNIPHPLEDKILIRIQTEKGYSAGDILCRGLEDLHTVFDQIQKKFGQAYSDFKTGRTIDDEEGDEDEEEENDE
uniref:DNA-directed RNA polymerase I subunit D n=1 Tax=Meloidogyne incognita TaxID=6306 RepID=A0A914KS63_MELIC